jgi:hypothetical protein
MKKIIYLLFTVLFCTTVGMAQEAWNWVQWANNVAISDIVISDITTDSYGNFYMTGGIFYFNILDNDTIIAPRESRFFLAKFDTMGHFGWLRLDSNQTGGPSNGYGVATDAQGNVYAVGAFADDTMELGNVTLRGPGLNKVITDIFIVKYDSSGNALWGRAVGNYGQDGAQSVCVDINNNAYVTGNFFDTLVIFDSDTLHNGSGGGTTFLTKYSSTGNVLWATAPPAYGINAGYDLAADAVGNVFLAGYFNGSIDFGGWWYTGNLFTHNNAYLAKYDSAGNVIWAKVTGGGISQQGTVAVATDASGNAYLTGTFTGDTLLIGTQLLHNPGYPSNDMFIAKFNPGGQVDWAKAASNTHGSVSGNHIATYRNQAVYVTGGYADSLFIFDSTTVSVSPFSLPQYLLQLDTGGSLQCSFAIGGGSAGTTDVCTDLWGNTYLSGNYGYGFSIGAYNLPLAGLLPNGFAGRFECNGRVCNTDSVHITAETKNICANDSSLICAPTGFASYAWNSGQTTACFYTSIAGNYYVKVTDIHGCMDTSNTIAIVVNAPPSVSITISGDTLTASNGLTFQWYINGSPLPGDNGKQIVGTKAGEYTVQITDSNGCTNTSNPVSLAGVNQLSADAITLYPNPSAGSWHLAIADELVGAALEVWNNEGQIIHQSKITSVNNEINLPALANGVYFLRISSSDGVMVRKIVKL